MKDMECLNHTTNCQVVKVLRYVALKVYRTRNDVEALSLEARRIPCVVRDGLLENTFQPYPAL